MRLMRRRFLVSCKKINNMNNQVCNSRKQIFTCDFSGNHFWYSPQRASCTPWTARRSSACSFPPEAETSATYRSASWRGSGGSCRWTRAGLKSDKDVNQVRGRVLVFSVPGTDLRRGHLAGRRTSTCCGRKAGASLTLWAMLWCHIKALWLTAALWLVCSLCLLNRSVCDV